MLTAIKKTVLVIDDDADFQDLLTDILEHEGYEVDKTGSMAGAYTHLQEHKPDLVILDICLPDGDGLEFCRQLTSDERTSEVPVLLLSGRTGLETRVRGFLNGAMKYITKPFDMDYLIETVGALSHRASAKSLTVS